MKNGIIFILLLLILGLIGGLIYFFVHKSKIATAPAVKVTPNGVVNPITGLTNSEQAALHTGLDPDIFGHP